jgi:type I restriction-modification system DNA methylase subunit
LAGKFGLKDKKILRGWVDKIQRANLWKNHQPCVYRVFTVYWAQEITMCMPIPARWLESLRLIPREGKDLILDKKQATSSSYAHIISDAVEAGVSGVFCVEGKPCAALLVAPDDGAPSKKELQKLYKILWNQGEFDYLIVLFPEVAVIHTFSSTPEEWSVRPVLGDGKPSPTWLAALHIATDAVALSEVITGIESGRFLAENPESFNADARVDATLINDLGGIRKILFAYEGCTDTYTVEMKLIVESIHAVLLQMLFLLYLEDRGILGQAYIHAHGNPQHDSLWALLENSPKDFCKMLHQLDGDLNGGLFTPDILWEKYAGLFAAFLKGETNFANQQQGRLLRLYRFDYIPVELLSEIYDRFFHAEQEKKARGAYYTTRHLASLVVDQVWDILRPDLDQKKLPTILDPACGSGIFLATLFQRIASYLPSPTWETLKKLAEQLHGLDTDPIALRISAFSLSLALLNSREPKELQERIENDVKLLPNLLGKSLLRHDFFDYASSNKFDCIIGNPPWGTLSAEKGNTGEKWLTSQKSYPKSPNKERSWPFIWKGREHLSTNGALAFLLPVAGFFLNDTTDCLKYLLRKLSIERLIDLSGLRRMLFNSEVPACIFCATRTEEMHPHSFEYICPKADIYAVRGERILLASEDYHTLSAWIFALEAKKCTQRAMWASPIELKLLAYIDSLPTLRDFPIRETVEARKHTAKDERPNWGMGLGFQAYNGNGKPPYHLDEFLTLPHMPTTKFRPWVLPFDISCRPYGQEEVRCRNYLEGFFAPHIVMPYSMGKRLKATWAEWDFSFNNTFFSITVPDSNEGKDEGQFLTAYLNSMFVSWYMSLSLGLAAHIPRFTPSLILSVPYPKPESCSDPGKSNVVKLKTTNKIKSLMQRAKQVSDSLSISEESFPTQKDITELDGYIFEYLGIRAEEMAAIKDYIELVRPAIRPSKEGKLPALWQPSDGDHWQTYCSWLSKALTEAMENDETRALASVCAYSKDIVVVEAVKQQRTNNEFPSAPLSRPRPLQELAGELLKPLQRELGGNIYLQRCALVFEDHKIYIIKPRTRRFWLTGMAYADANRVIEHLLQAAYVSGSDK